MSKELAIKILETLGNMVWIENNIHNFYHPEFKELLLAAIQDARDVYFEFKKVVEEME